ncbi:Ig-like domain-containing protein [Paenibacillus koleovorans]|uniref:Ig-like domain-containing protein n=1 Tax=Paenibacillus koleovorans TaxID=121608 RepID=UPI000FDB06AB|nr:Ig-like domain-containing protein [Paenibacillus koleovorans]
MKVLRNIMLWRRPSIPVLIAGIACLMLGWMYTPWHPFYILGDLQEAEIRSWGNWAEFGGVAAIAGSLGLSMAHGGIRKLLLVISMPGMLAIATAQVLPILMWLMYGLMGAEFTSMYVFSPQIGMLVGVVMHGFVAIVAGCSIVLSVQATVARNSEDRLTRKSWFAYIGSILLVLAAWVGIEATLERTWMHSTSPKNGATGVSKDITVSAVWDGSRGNNLGMKVRYADAPDQHIPGGTSGSQSGMSFKPDQPFLPGKTLVVTVEAGRRSYNFQFQTAEADESSGPASGSVK